MTTSQQQAGRDAKRVGHEKEAWACEYLTEQFGGEYAVDGGNRTKIDIYRTDEEVNYSLKSVSGKNTQCHLTTVNNWCEFFGIEGDLRSWFDQFFGVAGEDISNGTSSQHRLSADLIDSELNELAMDWFNANRMRVFEVIIRSGFYNTPVDFLIWHNKKTQDTKVIDINDMATMVYNGEWRLSGTVLHFYTGGKKLFHLQMKGSGKKYTAGYHGLMFHLHA